MNFQGLQTILIVIKGGSEGITHRLYFYGILVI